MKTWYAIRARAESAEVSIYDEIGAFGVSAKGFLAELAALASAHGREADANPFFRHLGPIEMMSDVGAARRSGSPPP